MYIRIHMYIYKMFMNKIAVKRVQAKATWHCTDRIKETDNGKRIID